LPAEIASSIGLPVQQIFLVLYRGENYPARGFVQGGGQCSR